MIRVGFDESLLGEKPVQPVAPEEPAKPDGYQPASEEPADEEPANDPEDQAPAPEGEEPEASEGEDEDGADARPQEFKDYDLALMTFKQQKTEYELKLSQFEEKQREFEESVAQGQKLVGELNERFGKWFYVISADNLDSLQLKHCLLYTSPSPRDQRGSRMPSSA